MAIHRTLHAKRPDKQKKRVGFLDLPGEIRNEIYAYCFEADIWVDMTPSAHHVLSASSIRSDAAPRSVAATASPTANANANNNVNTSAFLTGIAHRKTVTVSLPKKPQKIKYHRHKDKTKPRPPPNWARTPGALTRTCRQIHAESLPFFYATIFFIFSGPNALLRFVRGGRNGHGALPPAKLALIRKVHIAHATYGDPFRPCDAVWKARSDATWARAMQEAAARLTGLQVLRLRIVVNERPMVFGLDAWWVKALMVWREACRPQDPQEQERDEKAPLQVTISVQSLAVAKGMGVATIREPMDELHRLFSEAVKKRLLGCSEEEAMDEYNKAKFGKWGRIVEWYPMP